MILAARKLDQASNTSPRIAEASAIVSISREGQFPPVPVKTSAAAAKFRAETLAWWEESVRFLHQKMKMSSRERMIAVAIVIGREVETKDDVEGIGGWK